jgi:hypothetical protein
MAGERALALPERGDTEPERARNGSGPMCTPGGHRAAPERFNRGVRWRSAPVSFAPGGLGMPASMELGRSSPIAEAQPRRWLESALALPERGETEPERARNGPGPMCTPGGHRAAPERFNRGVCWRSARVGAPFQCLQPWKGGRSSADWLIGEPREHCLRFDTGKGVCVGRKVGNMSANHVGGGERETFAYWHLKESAYGRVVSGLYFPIYLIGTSLLWRVWSSNRP